MLIIINNNIHIYNIIIFIFIMEPLRFALQLTPPIIVLEYKLLKNQQLYHHYMHIKNVNLVIKYYYYYFITYKCIYYYYFITYKNIIIMMILHRNILLLR